MWGDRAAILIRENETLLPATATEPSPRHPDDDPGLRAVFLGRLVEHKGLHIALEAIAKVSAPIELDVYGPMEDPKYVELCRGLITALPATATVRMLGMVDPDQTRTTLSGYDVLLMPTAGENFGHVVAESLSVSCPVMCSPHTPWNDVLEDGGGWVLDRTPEAWTSAIEAYALLSPEERQVARERAAAAYARWRARPSDPHVLELLESHLAASA